MKEVLRNEFWSKEIGEVELGNKIIGNIIE